METLFAIVVFCVMLVLLYRPLMGDFDDHPIWNIIYVIPTFYLMPFTLFVGGIEESSILLTLLGIIQIIVHIGIVFVGYDVLFISKITCFLLEAVFFLLRIGIVLRFISFAMILIKAIPYTNSSLFYYALNTLHIK